MSDMTDSYNTMLSADDEKTFQQWIKSNGRQQDLKDYDMRGYWQANQMGQAKQAANAHFPDTYKKPNHPTFSDESMYHGQDGYVGGHWSEQEGKDVFTPGSANTIFQSQDELQQYFKMAEPNVILNMPGGNASP